MKKQIALILALQTTLRLTVTAQQLPTSTLPGPAFNGQGDVGFWSRAGNTGVGGGLNNIFGTRWNSPIYSKTNNVFRMWLNDQKSFSGPGAGGQPTIKGVAYPLVNTSGYLGLGNCAGISPLNPLNAGLPNSGPWTLFHLEGPDPSGLGGNGWRRWMKTGTLTRENSDHMYVGLKDEGLNHSDAMIAWGDDAVGAGFKDVLRFTMTSNASSGNGSNNNPKDGAGFNGYEFLRMVPATGVSNSAGFPVGHIGIGPLFNNTNEPKSRLHIHSEDFLTNYLQWSSESGTGPLATDGLRMGLFNVNANIAQSGNAVIYNQENRHILFSTNHTTPNAPNNTQERLRISSRNAPTFDPAGAFAIGGYPLPLPPFVFADATRVSISYLPNQPVTAPLSLFHIGGNTSVTNDGWRQWMDIGTLANIPSIGGVPGANLFTGVKFSPFTPASNRDAVIGWGFNPSTTGTNGNRLRFIFSSLASGPLASAGANGLEAGHFWSDGDNTRLGVGDFAANDPGNTLEIKSSPASPHWPVTTPGGASGLRLTNITTTTQATANTAQGVLSVDANGDVILVTDQTGTGTFNGAFNGTDNSITTTNPTGKVQLGQDVGQPGGPANLLNDREIPMNDKNIFFTGSASGPTALTNRIGIGATTTWGKLHVRDDNNLVSSANPQPLPQLVLSSNSSGGQSAISFGRFDGIRWSMGYAGDGGPNCANTAGHQAFRLLVNPNPSSNISDLSDGANRFFNSNGSEIAPNVAMTVREVNPVNGSKLQIGLCGIIDPQYNLHVNGDGGFHGNVIPDQANAFRLGTSSKYWIEAWLSGGVVTGSDYRLKENIKPLEYGLAEILKIKPVRYTLKKNPEYGPQLGVIAQDMQQVITEVVRVGDDSDKTMGVNYAELVPVLIKGIQEQQAQIEEQKKSNENLQKQLEELKLIVAGTPSGKTGANTSSINLSDKNIVVLNQNVPNPFAEQTLITYNLPEKFTKAQITFNKEDGKIIKIAELTTPGYGELRVFASDISNGLYTYTLIIDGNIIETKKMVKQ